MSCVKLKVIVHFLKIDMRLYTPVKCTKKKRNPKKSSEGIILCCKDFISKLDP